MYYTLIVKYETGDPWAPEFGSANRDECIYELGDGEDGARYAASRIIATIPGQANIDARIAELNA